MKYSLNLKLIVFLFFIKVNPLWSQVMPKVGSILNYNQVMLQYPIQKKAICYKIEVCEYDSANASKAISTKTYTDSTNLCLISDLNFGKYYTWQVTGYQSNGKKLKKNGVYAFSLLKNEYNDTSRFRINQFYNLSDRYQKGIIWLDKYFCALDRAGKIVWQFPQKIKTPFRPDNMVDLHLCNNGNLILSNDTSVYYFTKDLKVIWSKHASELHSSVKVKNIHHVFNQLPNGNFIALGATTEKFKLSRNDTAQFKYDNHIILEFNPKGDLIWFWELKNHLNPNLLVSYLKKYGSKNAKLDVMLHANSVAYDSSFSHLYLGLRDFNRLMKIDRKTGMVLAEYGQKLTEIDTNVIETNFFRRQHDIKPIAPNTVLLFNNGEEDPKDKSSIQILKLPISRSEKVEKIWEMDLTIDSLPGKAVKYGSVQKLSNGNFLIGGGMNGRILEVTSDKKPVWDLYLQGRMMAIFKWGVFAQYRAYFNSSLYPYYFSVLLKDNKLYLHNEGTDKDQYLIETFSTVDYQSTSPIKTLTTNFINPNTNFVFELDLKNTKLVKVTSLQANTVEVINLSSDK